MKYNVKTKKLMTINYGNEKDNLPLKINWFLNGNYKRITFTKGGTLHRTDGPAEIIFSQDGSCTKKYYINGKEITDELQITLLDLEDVYNTNYYEMRKQNN